MAHSDTRLEEASATAEFYQEGPGAALAELNLPTEAAPIGRATYSPEDNRLRLYPFSRLGMVEYGRVKKAGFSWAPKQQLFVAPKWTPEREDLLIALCGEIEDEDTSLVERAEERAERFETYSEKRELEAERAKDYVAKIADGIPLGQPILVGHHSERKARKDAERIQNGMRKAVTLWETSKYWERRAKGALAHAKYKERPEVRARRIKTIEAEERKALRSVGETTTFIKLWSVPDLTRERALKLANYGHVRGVWSDLDKASITVEQAREKMLATLQATLNYNARLAEHCRLRLIYERCMLEESGYVAPPKVKSLKETLPLLNYRAETISYDNPYHRGEVLSVPQIEMTKAEYAKIHKDYKGTAIVERSHKVRTAIDPKSKPGERGLAAVFLTDSKVHEKPAPAAPPEPPLPAPRAPRSIRREPERTDFDAMKESLHAGVQVVSAPQLFRTPSQLASRMVELSEIEPGHRVLEPSAGTGVLVGAVRDAQATVICTAVEINGDLATRVQLKFGVQVIRGDFLEMDTSAVGGPFDRVLMNPPFSAGADVAHILHAISMLRAGGRCVAICANGPRQQAKLKPRASYWEELPDDTFAQEGTHARAALAVFDAT